jgi:uncharacterized protein (TIRG00374 family)
MSPRSWFALSILVSLTVIVIVFVTTFNEQTILYILTFNVLFLFLAISFRLLALVFWGLRIQLMSRSLGYKVPLPHCVNMVLAGLLVGTITPGSAGGEPLRAHELYRSGVRLGDAAAVVIVERILDGIVLTLMGIILMAVITEYVLATFGPTLLFLVVIAWIVMAMFLAVPLLTIRHPEWTKRQLRRLLNWLVPKLSFWRSAKRFGELADKEIDNLFISGRRFIGTARMGLFQGGVMTALFWVTEFAVASFVLMGLGFGPFLVQSFFFQIVIAIIGMLPLTPGSSGVTEISTSSLYALIIPTASIGVFVLLWRFVTFYLNILLGFAASLAIFRREIESRDREKEQPAEEA